MKCQSPDNRARTGSATYRSACGGRTPPICRGTLLAVLLAVHTCIIVEGRETAQASALSYEGSSFLTPKPAASSSFQLIVGYNITMFGQDILTRTTQSAAFASMVAVVGSIFGPTAVQIRWTYYTAHPAQTPGLENYTALVQHIDLYGEVTGGLQSTDLVLSLNTVEVLAIVRAQIASSVASRGTPIWMFMNYATVATPRLLQRGPQTAANVSSVGVSEVLSRIQLRGYNLLPFHFDKQTLVLNTIQELLVGDGVRVGFINMSDWSMAEASTRSSRRLLADQVDVFYVEVWMKVFPWGGLTAPLLWSNVTEPDTRVFDTTKKWGIPTNISFLNATLYTRPKGGLYTIVSTSSGTGTPADSTEAFGAASMSNGISTAGIAGIAAGAVLLLALAVLGALLLLRRKRTETSESDGKGGSEVNSVQEAFEAFGWRGQINPDEIEICKRPDGKEWLLGEGSCGKVYKALRRGTTVVAIKKLNYNADEEMLFQMRKESAILQRVANDPNVVQFFGTCPCNPPMLCMEYMEGGDLHSALRRDVRLGTHEFDWSNKGAEVALAVAQGLHFLHTSGVIHRDVKSNNILLTAHGVAKVADVGLASMIDHFSSTGGVYGNFACAAPEVLMGEKCTTKMDVYSYGILLWAIVTKELPRRGSLRKINVPEECPEEIVTLILECIATDQKKRPAMKDIVERLGGSTGRDSQPASTSNEGMSLLAEDQDCLDDFQQRSPTYGRVGSPNTVEGVF